MQVSTTILFCEFYYCRIFMDRVNSHTKSYNIPRSFEAIITKLELAWPVRTSEVEREAKSFTLGVGSRSRSIRSRGWSFFSLLPHECSCPVPDATLPLPSFTQFDSIYHHSACPTQFPDRITAQSCLLASLFPLPQAPARASLHCSYLLPEIPTGVACGGG